MSSLAIPAFQDGKERQVGAAQVGSPTVLEDIADGPCEAALRVMKRSHEFAIQSQLQDQSVAWQQNVIPVQGNHLETQTHWMFTISAKV